MSDLNGRTIAVTGATGFLGSHIVEELVQRGATVVGVVRTPAKGAWLEGPNVSFRKADLSDRDSLTAAFDGVDAVVANAALSAGWVQHSKEEFIAANVLGTENTLAATADAGVKRLVMVSTVAVYRTRLFSDVSEADEKIDPDNPRFDINHVTTNKLYSLSKAKAEQRAWQIAEERDLAFTAVRPGPIYGPRDGKLTARYGRWMQSFVRFAPTVRIPHVHGRDVAGAIGGALANDDSVGNAYNTTGESVSIWRALSAWKRLAGGGPLLIPVPVPFRVGFDDAAAERDLGFASRSIEDGVQDVLASL